VGDELLDVELEELEGEELLDVELEELELLDEPQAGAGLLTGICFS
jgi:hypothetical protein